MSNSSVIKTTGLTYHYSKGIKTLNDINLQVERGSIYGFLGPNGSGKTTTLSLLLGLLNNQRGDIEIFGQHLHSNRVDILRKTGSLIESPSLYGQLTARENLEVLAPKSIWFPIQNLQKIRFALLLMLIRKRKLNNYKI